MSSIHFFSLGSRPADETSSRVQPFGTHWPLALLAVGLLATPGCKKEEAPPASAPAPAAPKPKAAAPATGTNAVAGGAGTNAAAGVGEAVDLRLKWPVGKRYLQRIDVVEENETKTPGVPQAIPQESVQSLNYTVTVLQERDGGGRELEVEFAAQKIDSKNSGRPLVTFDSTSDPKGDRTNAVAATLRKLVGLKFHYLTDTNGRIEKVVGAQEMRTKLLANVNLQTRGVLTSLLSEDNLKRVITLDLDLPVNPVKIGDAWPMQRDNPMGQLGTVLITATNAFKGWVEHEKRRCALIEYTGSLTNKPAVAPVPAGIQINTVVESGRTSGKSWFDPATGMIIDSYSEQEMTMKISSAGVNSERKTRKKITVKLIEIGDAPKAN